MAKIHCYGEIVTRLRTQQGMTQEKLAAMSRVNIRTIQRAERGEYLQLETVASIAAALKVTVPELSVSEDSVGPAQIEEEGDERESNAVVLRPVTSGKILLEIAYDSFSGKLYCEVEPTQDNVEPLTAMIEEIEGLIPNPWDDPAPGLSLSERLRRSVTLTAKLAALERFEVAVFAGTYTARAQIPRYDTDEGHMYIRDRFPFEPVTICRVTLAPRKNERVVIKVTDKWVEPAPGKADSDDEADDIPF
jgi:transcriptional regulator with XRE-family HTH domain